MPPVSVITANTATTVNRITHPIAASIVFPNPDVTVASATAGTIISPITSARLKPRPGR
jgi:hypothetical protein